MVFRSLLTIGTEVRGQDSLCLTDERDRLATGVVGGYNRKVFFYVHGSVHRESMSVIVKQDATIYSLLYRVSQEECARLREGVPYVKVYNPKHLCPKLNGYGDNDQRKVWSSGGSTHCTCQLTSLIDVCP